MRFEPSKTALIKAKVNLTLFLNAVALFSLIIFSPAIALAQDHKSSNDKEEWEARILRVRGEVHLLLKGSSDYYPAQVQTPLEAGDTVQTGTDGSCDIALESGNIIRLEKGTEFNVEQLHRQAPIFSLSFGSLIAKLTGLVQHNARLEIRTPTAIAAVRGTEFAIETIEDQTHFGVFDEGQISVRSEANKEELLLLSKQELQVMRHELFGTPKRIEALLEQHKQMAEIRQFHKNLRRDWRSMEQEKRQQFRQQMLAQRVLHQKEMMEKLQLVRDQRQQRMAEFRMKFQQRMREDQGKKKLIEEEKLRTERIRKGRMEQRLKEQEERKNRRVEEEQQRKKRLEEDRLKKEELRKQRMEQQQLRRQQLEEERLKQEQLKKQRTELRPKEGEGGEQSKKHRKKF